MGKQHTRILVVDDHPVVRAGICACLSQEDGYQIVAEAGDGREAVRIAERLKPDIAVIDLTMPVMDGIEATRRIVDASSRTRVIALSVHRKAKLVHSALQAGATGFVMKEQMLEALVEAVDTVVAGGVYVAPEAAGAVLGSFTDRTPVRPSNDHIPPLTARERQVLRFIARGWTSKRIANRLGVTPKTVSTHRQHIMDKLDLHNAARLTRYVLETGHVSADDTNP